MLRFRNEALWLALRPTQVGGVLAGRHKRNARVLGTLDFPLQSGADAVPALLAALAQWLGQHEVAGCKLNVIVSDRLVRHALIPFNAVPLRAAEEQALHHAHFSQLYGDSAQWRVVADRPAYGQARIACALPASLVDGLASLRREHRLRRGAIQPFFVACANRVRRPQRADAGMIAVAERDNLVLAAFDRSGWSSLRSIALADGAGTSADVVADAIHREKLIRGLDAELDVAMYGAAVGPHAPCIGMVLAGAGA